MVNKKDQCVNGERRKKTRGRVKIEMKTIEKQSNRQVTFSKRKHGLFNKASQLCVLTGAEMAIIVQSVAGKRVFSFGHKSVDSVIDRFLHNRTREQNSEKIRDDYKEEELELAELDMEIKAEKNGDDGGGFWWAREVGELELAELERYEAALVELMKNVDTKATTPSSSSSSLVLDEGLTGINPAVDAYSNSFDDTLMEMHEAGAAFEYYNYQNFNVDHLGRFESF